MESSNIQRDIFDESHHIPVVVQFYANWCGPCKALKPTMQQLAKKAGDKWRFVSVNIENHQGLAAQYSIKSVPTVFMFYKEEPIARFMGNKPAHIVENWIDNNLPNRRYQGDYQDLDEALRHGNVSKAKQSILDLLMEKYKDSTLIKLLSVLENLGQNSKKSRQHLEELEREGPFGELIKKLRDLLDDREYEKDVKSPKSSPYDNRAKDVFNKIDVRAIDFDLLSRLVHNGINNVRNNQGLQDLLNHTILGGAARDQNEYQIRYDELTHYQQNPNKRSVKERIEAFGGGFRMMAENVQYRGFPTRIFGNRKEIITNTYQETADQMVKNWVNSPGHYKNLINPNYRYVGTAVGWNPENSALFATQVFGA